MQYILFAAAETAEGGNDLLGALGIDWKLLIVQVISFLLLVAILRRFVYPALNKALDEREKSIAASVEAAEKAKDDAVKAEAEIEGQLATARKEAETIIETAHKEAAAMVEAAQTRAEKKADHIIENAQAQLQLEVQKAQEVIRKDAVELVARATETIIGEKLDAKKDASLIENAMRSAK